jgi:hypothetical protein
MADRRMISLQIMNSAKFLKMPISAQALYVHLVVRADDDGVVESYGVLRLVGANDDDLKILAAKGYIIVLNDDYVTYINNWMEFNTLRADRSKDSIHHQLLVSVLPNVPVLIKKERSDRLKKKSGTSHGQSMDGITEDKLREVKLKQQQDKVVVAVNKISCIDNNDNRVADIWQQKELLMLLSKLGCTDQQAIDLVTAYGIVAVRTQLKAVSSQEGIRNPIGWLLSALKEGYVDYQAVASAEKEQRKIENEQLMQTLLEIANKDADVVPVNNFKLEYQKYKESQMKKEIGG